MKRSTLAGLIGVATLGVVATANAAEFQTPGMLGTGRAGIARTTDAYATFVNPAGLAFNEKSFSAKFSGGVGVAISSSLAENVDKIGKLNLSSSDLNYDLKPTDNGYDANKASGAAAKAVQFIGIVDDIAARKGDLAVNVDLALGFQYKSFGLGIIGASELGAGVSYVDKDNIRTGTTISDTSASTNINTLTSQLTAATDLSTLTPNTGLASRPPAAQQIFTGTQYTTVVNAFLSAQGLTSTTASDQQLATAQALTSKLESYLAANNPTSMTSDQLVQALQATAKALDPTKGNIDQNNTTVDLRGIAIAEIPLGYGHKFDLGAFGKIGIGGAVKVMQATVYSQEVKVMQIKDSADLVKKAKDSKTDSTAVGVDLGAMWRFDDLKSVGPINLAFVIKNINSPEFDAPKASGAVPGFTKIKVEPQARAGIALQPFSWLDIVADADLTKNKSVMPGRDSQNIGAGLELNPVSFFALRAGVMENIAETSAKPVLTAGLSLGPHWLRLDIDGAVSTDTGKYQNTTYPREAKVEFGLSTAF